MPAKFYKSPSIADEVRELIELRYPPLRKAAIGVLMTTGDVKDRGVDVAVKVKVNDEAARLQGMPDATITISQFYWNIVGMQVADAGRLRTAMLDRALHSIKALVDKDDQPRKDEHGRPMLSIRDPDIYLCGYAAIARRHGRFAPEVIEAGRLKEEHGELLFGPEDEDPAGPTPEAVIKDTFAALLTVGHTEPQARRAIDRVTEGGRSFANVAAMIDAIYSLSPDELVGQVMDDVAAEINAGALDTATSAVTATVRGARRAPKTEAAATAAGA